MYNQTNRKRGPYDKAHLSFRLQRYCFFRYSANISLFCQRKVANATGSTALYRTRCVLFILRVEKGTIKPNTYFRATQHLSRSVPNTPYFPQKTTPHTTKKGSLTHSPDRLFLYHFRGIIPPGSSPLRTYCLPLPAYAACSARSLP